MAIKPFFKQRNLTDEEIIAGILGKERERNRAIEALYNQNRGFLLKFLQGKSNDRYMVKQPEDIIWEAIMAVLNNVLDKKYIPSLSVPLSGYLTTICKNLWYKNINQEENRDLREQNYLNDFGDYEPDVSTLLANQQQWEHYLMVFEKAGKNCQQIFTLWLVDGMDNKQIAEVMIHEGKLKSEQSLRNAKSDCLQKVTDLLK